MMKIIFSKRNILQFIITLKFAVLVVFVSEARVIAVGPEENESKHYVQYFLQDPVTYELNEDRIDLWDDVIFTNEETLREYKLVLEYIPRDDTKTIRTK